MKALKKITFISILFFLLIGCKKQELDEQLVKAILDYEKNVPIPKIKRENSSREYVFVYLVDFIKEKGDTIIKINRNSNGIYQNVDYYGVYMVEGKTPVVITDNDSLGKNFIRIKIKNNLLNKYRIEDYKSHYDEYLLYILIKSKRIPLT